MELIRLAIVDMNAQDTDNAVRYLSACPDIEIVICEADAQTALERLKRTKTDVLLLDPVQRGIDGLTLMREVNRLKDPPIIVCWTHFYSQVMLDSTRHNGASYFMFKPVDYASTYNAITECHQSGQRIRRIERATAEVTVDAAQRSLYIRNYITSVGIPSKLIGCAYLAEGIRLAQQDSTLMRNLSKGLYLEIARSMNSTPVRIERSIRTAINAAYKSGTLRYKTPSCPSNKEFIDFVLRDLQQTD